MRDELLALFRDTERSRVHQGLPATRGGTDPAIPSGSMPAAPAEPSRFLRRFLQPSSPTPEPAPSGLPSLDSRLEGGFGSGPHLVMGLPGAGKTAFIESLAWEAVSSERPVLYYALQDGAARVWERLISTVGCILGGPSIPLAAIRARRLSPEETETIARLDQTLQTHVFPYLSLVDVLPPSTPTVSAFIEDVRLRAQDAIERHGRIPLLLVDDVERLLFLTGTDPLPAVLSRLDGALTADSMPGLLASAAPPTGIVETGRLPVHTVIVLESVTTLDDDELSRVDLEVRGNIQTGWTGTLPLLLDHRTGLFSDISG